MEQTSVSSRRNDTARLFLNKYSRAFTVLPEKLENIRSKLLFSQKISSEKADFGCLTLPKEFNKHFASLQNWFIHISHVDKVRFVTKLIKEFLKKHEADLLLEYLELSLPSKEIFYGRTHYIKTPIDESRTKSLGAMSLEAEDNSFMWFNSLREKDQIIVVIILTRLGGSSVLYSAAREVLLRRVGRKKISKIETKEDRSPIAKQTSPVEEVEITRLNSKQSECQSLNDLPYRDSIKTKKEAEWEEMYAQLLQEVEHAESVNKDLQDKTEPIDMLQMLPISVNRVIYSKLDFKSRVNLRNLNTYWKTMSSEIQKEESTRNWLNKMIRKHKYTTISYKGRSWSSPYIKQYTGGSKRTMSTDSMVALKARVSDGVKPPRILKGRSSFASRKFDDTGSFNQFGRSYSVPNIKLSNFELKPRSDFEIKLKKRSHKLSPYTGKHTVVMISESYDHDRVMAVSKQWIAVSDGSNINLHSTLTGAPSPARLEGHSSCITALVFHPVYSRVFSASYDTTVRYWEIYSRSLIQQYIGHKSVITSISVNEVFLCSASMDQTVKVFDIDSASVMWTLECVTTPTVLAIDKKQTLIVGSFVGHVEKILLTYDEDFKKSEVCLAEKLPQTVSDDERFSDVQADNFSDWKFESKSSKFDATSCKSEILDEEDRATISYLKTNGKIRYAHSGEITSIFIEVPLIFTAGADGVVHVWHYSYFEEGSLMTLQHRGRRVNDVTVSFLSILTACEDGRLRVWDIETRSMKKEIVVNSSGRPIISMAVLEVFDHSKIVINNEDGIKVLIFSFDWVKLKRTDCRQDIKKLPAKLLTRVLNTSPSEILNKRLFKKLPKNKTFSEVREDRLATPLQTVDEIHAVSSKHVISKDLPTVLQAMNDRGSMIRFQRFLLTSDDTKVRFHEKANKKENLPRQEDEHVLVSKKDFLTYFNPFKTIL